MNPGRQIKDQSYTNLWDDIRRQLEYQLDYELYRELQNILWDFIWQRHGYQICGHMIKELRGDSTR